MKSITEEEACELRKLDEEERLLWQTYAATHNGTDLEKITQITTRKDEIYGLEKRNEEL